MAVSTGAAIAGGALLGSLNGSRKAGDITQTSAPWEAQQPYLRDLFGRAQNTLNQGYGGQVLTPMASGQLADTIGGKYLDPAANPALQGYVNDALGLVKSQFAGQVGGPAGQNLGNSGYQEMLARTLANTALPIYANAYGQERQNQLAAAGGAPGFDAAGSTSPFAPLEAYQRLISGNYGGTVTQPFFNNPAAGALGGALAGGQIFKMLGGGGLSPAAALASGVAPL
jgi:hypothetical protein